MKLQSVGKKLLKRGGVKNFSKFHIQIDYMFKFHRKKITIEREGRRDTNFHHQKSHNFSEILFSRMRDVQRKTCFDDVIKKLIF